MISDINLEPKQMQAFEVLLDETSKYILMGGGAGGGKTWLGCTWLLVNCYKYPNSKWFIGRNELKRLMSTTYVTWTKVCKEYKIPQNDWKLNGQYNYIEFIQGRAKGSRIDLLDLAFKPTDPFYERLGSSEFSGGWIEEAGEIKYLAFDVLKSRIGRHMNKELSIPPKILLTCNPSKNWLHRTFYKPYVMGELDPKYSFIKALYTDNSYTADDYGEMLSEIKDNATRERLRDGNWDYSDDDNSLVNFDAITDIFSNALVDTKDKYLTADIARYGGDRIVIGIWQGLDCIDIIIKQKQSLETTKQEIKDLLAKHQIPYSQAVIDDDGVGGGVVDGLFGVIGFVNNSRPLDINKNGEKVKENYKNLKSQCSFMLADHINYHKIKVSAKLSEADRDLLIEELGQLKRKKTPDDSTLQVISKDEVKENLGRSPDISDMLMMRMRLELESQNKGKYFVPREVFLNERRFDY